MAENNTVFSKSQKEKIDPFVMKAAVVLAAGSIVPLLDSTMVNVAVNSVAVDLSTTVSVIQWVITGYMLAMALAIPVSGWAGSRFGGKRVYIFSLILFLAGSVLSSLSWNAETLIVFRLIQGFGAGLMFTTMQTLLVQISGGEHLGLLMSYVSIPAVMGPVLGPVLGGFIVSSLNWRWIFYVNIPVTIIAVLLTWYVVPGDKKSDNEFSMDWPGIFLLSPAIATIIYGISMVSSGGGFAGSAVLVPLGIGILLLGVFVVRSLNLKKKPVLDLRLFRSKNFSASCILLFLLGVVLNGAMLLLPLYFQQVRGESVLYTGLLLIPQGIGTLLTRGWFGRLTDSFGSRQIVMVSLVMTVLGTLPFAFADEATSPLLLAAALVLRGAGIGGLFSPVMVSAYVGIEKEHISDASIATRSLQNIGGAFGPAVLATVVGYQLQGDFVYSVRDIAGAYNATFWWLIVLTIIGLIPALFLSVHRK
ncbi:EmrB/QacA subfamily drug resistance transporter [Methanomicrobium sp. W14]|uniref:MDR family MFS transporter n=1 Tax=Methanomicrobium sp. W14 TaxID=2817839 RepID=UPI001AE49A4B|nr:MDR family MFS transporter [Methanomicrobium sp. W14]MBP2133286.1 EmrB/QacA subfamily drug resistance transporter [Methanomicrobium sp. W14]